MAESDRARPTALDGQFTAQVERRHDGSLVTALYRDGSRVHELPVRSLRQGKRRAYDLLCTAVDTGGAAFPMVVSDPVAVADPVAVTEWTRLPEQFAPTRGAEREPKPALTPRVVAVVWSAHAGAH